MNVFLLSFTDGLTASAIILAVLAIGFEVAFFIIQTQQLYRSQRDSAEYVGQMREVLGKIEGLTTGTRDQLQLQFDRVLEAALKQEAPSASAALGATTDEDRSRETPEPVEAWLTHRIVLEATRHPMVKRFLLFLAPEREGKNWMDVKRHMEAASDDQERNEISGSLSLLIVFGSLSALDAVETESERMFLTDIGRRAVQALPESS